MIIIGAGLSGLIAANYFRKHDVLIVEAQDSLPNNHEALLRFKSDIVSKVTGINFEKVVVRKAISYEGEYIDRPNPFLCNMYSIKTNGSMLSRSIWDLEPCNRYIAPGNLINLLAKNVNIDLGVEFSNFRELPEPVVSTIPMPVMMDIVKWPNKPKFNYKTIWAASLDIIRPACDVYQTIYYPSLNDFRYRASITGNKLIIEFIKDVGDDLHNYIEKSLADFGILKQFAITRDNSLSYRKQQYGKIIPIDDDARKEFIYFLTTNYGIYSIGRFATWKQILLDDVVSDLAVVERLISVSGGLNKYSQRLSAK